MKNLWWTLCCIFIFSSFISEEPQATHASYKVGEYLKFRMHYLGVTAGYATLDVSHASYNGKPHYHAVGKGWTTGATKVFFKVDDLYETYIDTSTLLPSKFVRDIYEGGYVKNKVITFDQANKRVTINNKKYDTQRTYKVSTQVQDMLSAFYYLRSLKPSSFSTGSVKEIKVFMDEEIYPFKVKVLGKETIRTKFGNVSAIKLRPYVQSGRVFKENESVTFWVSNDENLMPLLIKAELMVGSLKAELVEYKNLSSTPEFN